MKIKEKYRHKVKQYHNLSIYFYEKSIEYCTDIDIDISNICIPECARVWLLFAKNNVEEEWKCLQVGESKNDIKGEIQDIIKYSCNKSCKNIVRFSNSAFYENVCPEIIKVGKDDYRETLYGLIGYNYKYICISFLKVDDYLGIKNTELLKTDVDKIVNICKNKYAEAKIAYETLAVYWRGYRSGIDGQTITYIMEHINEF